MSGKGLRQSGAFVLILSILNLSACGVSTPNKNQTTNFKESAFQSDSEDESTIQSSSTTGTTDSTGSTTSGSDSTTPPPTDEAPRPKKKSTENNDSDIWWLIGVSGVMGAIFLAAVLISDDQAPTSNSEGEPKNEATPVKNDGPRHRSAPLPTPTTFGVPVQRIAIQNPVPVCTEGALQAPYDLLKTAPTL